MDTSNGSNTLLDSSSGDVSCSDDSELAQLAKALKAGVEIKDRKWRTKTYPDCFMHSEAVPWTMIHKAQDEKAAVASLNALREAGFVQHVVDPHKCFKVGQTKKKLYFCFVEDCDRQPPSMVRKFIHRKQQANSNEKLSRRDMLHIWQSSDEWLALQTKLDRMACSISEITETQVATQTKLEIVHQATISLIQVMVYTGLLLLVLLVYTLVVIIPSLHQATLLFVVTTLVGILLIGAFVVEGRRIFEVWLTLDTCVIQAAEGDGCLEDHEVNLSTSTTASQASPRRGGILRRGGGLRRAQWKASSLFLNEPPPRSTSVDLKEDPNNNSTSVIRQRQAADLPEPWDWPHRPVLVCANTPVSPSLTVDPKYGNGPCPLGVPFRFESDLFEGQCLVRLRNVPNSESPDGDDAYFSGRRRLFQTVVQGRFKEALSVADVLTGHEFVKPLQHLPHPWILKAATTLIGKLAPGADIRVLGPQPTMLAGMAATSQIVRGDEPGNEPDIASTDNDLQEDCSLFGGKFSNGDISAGGRKLHLANPERARQYTYDTETVYSFDFYQNLLNCATYSLDLGVANINMAPVLNGQPIQCLCKTTDGRYLWSFQIWHESLLPPSSSDLDTVSSRSTGISHSPSSGDLLPVTTSSKKKT